MTAFLFSSYSFLFNCSDYLFLWNFLSYSCTMRKICQNTDFLWPFFSPIRLNRRFCTYTRKRGQRKPVICPILGSSKRFLFSKMSSIRLRQDVFRKAFCKYVLKTFRRRFEDLLEDKKMLHWRRLQDVFSTSSPRRMFAGVVAEVFC